MINKFIKQSSSQIPNYLTSTVIVASVEDHHESNPIDDMSLGRLHLRSNCCCHLRCAQLPITCHNSLSSCDTFAVTSSDLIKPTWNKPL